MVGARAPAARPRSGRFAERSSPRKPAQRLSVEPISPHHGSGRRPIEEKRTLKLRRAAQLLAGESISELRNHRSLLLQLSDSTTQLLNFSTSAVPSIGSARWTV